MLAVVAALVGAGAGAWLLMAIARWWKNRPIRGVALGAGGLSFAISAFELVSIGLNRGLARSRALDAGDLAAAAVVTALITLAIGLPIVALSTRR